MAHQSLYRRYRPQRFSEIRGQHHVRLALQNAVREGRWGHAYLFSGPRGTGKTSTARVLAKALNCQELGADGEPCTTCESCVAIEQGRSFDLHELDAASHNKVDDIRDLISKVALGSPGRTKVYILDEVHMLTAGAENALLKTLEEPPDHVVFVLATTEPHKVTATIRSRTQHYEFHLLAGEELADHVRWVIDDAGLDVGDDAVEYVLRAGGGSARDTLSALDLVTAAGGVPAGSSVAVDLAAAIGAGNPGAALTAVQQAMTTGREPRTIAEETMAHLRDAFLSAMGAPLPHLSDTQADEVSRTGAALGPATLTRALESLGAAVVEMRQAPDTRIPLEVCLLRLTRRTGEDPAALAQRVEALEIEVAALRAAAVAGASQPSGAPPAAPSTAADPGTSTSGPASAPDGATPPGTGPATNGSTTVRSDGPPSPPPPRRPADAARRTLNTREAARRPPPPPPPAGPEPTGPARRAPQPTSAPVAATTAGAGDGAGIDLAAIEAAWSTAVLQGLPNRARARYKPGRFLGVDGGTARFGLPNPIHRDRCAELQAEVEAALSAVLGQAVTLRLEVDAAHPERGGGAPSAGPGADDHDDIGDVTELADARDVASSGIERLTRAFPGSEVITHDD